MRDARSARLQAVTRAASYCILPGATGVTAGALMVTVLTLASASAAAVETVIPVGASEPLNGEPAEAGARPSRPLARSLSEALAQSRAVRAAGGGAHGTIVIELQPGIHRLTRPVHLTALDSGTPAAPLVIRSTPAGSAIIRGSVALEITKASENLLSRFPQASRPHLRAFRLPADLAEAPAVDVVRRHDVLPDPVPFEIFDAIGALHPARWPNTGWASGHSAAEGDSHFTVAPARTATWASEPEAWVSGYFRWDWAFEARPVAAFGPGKDGLTLAAPPQYGFAPAFRFAVHHLASELDEPGEWVRTGRGHELVVWPRDGGGALEASLAETLVEIDGAHDIRLEGLTFERLRGDAIVVHDSDDIEISDCTIRLAGRRAASIDGGHRSGVKRCLIEDTGEGGVLLAGGDRNSLEPAGHYLIDSIVRRFARLGNTYRPAVVLEGVGNRVEGNSISDAPHMAVSYSGNDHLIALNEIARVVTDTSDAGAIYTGRDWTAQGTIIRNNFIHDVRGRDSFDVKGIYLDDFASGTTVEGNLFVRVDQPVFIGGGRDNTITNNVFVRSEPAIHIDGRGRTWAAGSIADRTSELYRRLEAVPVRSLRWIERYPRLYALLKDDPADPKRNTARGNLVLESTVYRLYSEVDPATQRLEPAEAATAVLRQGSNDGVIGHAIDAADALRLLTRTRHVPELPFEKMDRFDILQRTRPPGQP